MSVGYAAIYDPDVDFDRWYTRASAGRIARWMAPGERVLELGCATGAMTTAFARTGARVVAVDHAWPYLMRLRLRGADAGGADTGAPAALVMADVEHLPIRPGGFDHVVAANVIHELDDPAAFLRRGRDGLGDDGLLHVTHQNPASLHRLVAKEMGLIDDLSSVSARGTAYGTRRLHTADELSALAAAAGLHEVHREGIMLKPLPNSLMEQLPDEVVEGFVRAGHLDPERCAINYLIFDRA
jgi:2-polyprenyl-3-methyl-5-hydroxy-6-metoxy-1,4-benzoquinol methylase